MNRVVVVGGPGAGKTTVAREIGKRLGVPCVELDALWWEPGWTPVAADEFGARVSAAMSADGWVADGNYLAEGAVEILWPAADVIVWLDLPRRTAFWRAVGRSTRRLRQRKLLWGTNREPVTNLGPRNLWRLWKRWPTYNAAIATHLGQLDGANPALARLRSRADIQHWLSTIG